MEEKNFIKKLFGFSVGTWIAALVGLIATPIVTRVFLPQDLGSINMFITIYTLSSYITLLGVNQAIIRFYHVFSDDVERDKFIKKATLISALASILIGMIFIIKYEFFSVYILDYKNFIIVICLILITLSNNIMIIINTENRMALNIKQYNIQLIIIALVTKFSFAIAAIISSQALYAIIFMTLFYVLTSIFFLVNKYMKSSKKKPVIASKEYITHSVSRREIIIYSLPWIFIMLASYINNSLPKIVIRELMNIEYVGIYSSAIYIVSIITIIQSGFNTFWTPYVYENYEKRNDSINLVHRMITMIMSIFALIIIGFQDVLILILGENFRESKEFLSLLLIVPVLYTIGETTGIGINIAKKSYLNIIPITLSIAVNLIISYYAIPKYGLVGASFAVASSAIIVFVTKTIIGELYYKISYNYFKTFSTPLILIICSLTITLFDVNLSTRTVLILISIILIFIININELKIIINFLRKILKNGDK